MCCVSFFSLYLYKLGIAPQIQDLLGKVDFTGKDLQADLFNTLNILNTLYLKEST